MEDTPGPLAAERDQLSVTCAHLRTLNMRLAKILSAAIKADDAGTLEMNSPEIGGEDDIPVHPWHEEWLHHAREAVIITNIM